MVHSRKDAAIGRPYSGATARRQPLRVGPRPVLRIDPRATILIAGQAPGSKVHASGIPFQGASGDRLREWMGIDAATLYDEARIAIVSIGDRQEATLMKTVRAWQEYWPKHLSLPHPSPRNNIWLKRSDWFEDEVLPRLRRRVREFSR